MSIAHPKLHIVLTAKAKHAEFKCALCKKLFISGYHLNRHKFRRHSHYFENILKKPEPMVKYEKAFQESNRSCQALSVSQRMEKLLRNLSVEDDQLLGIGNKLNSTSFIHLPNGIDNFPCASILSPINSNTSNLDKLSGKKINLTASYKSHFPVDVNKENYDALSSGHTNVGTQVTLYKLCEEDSHELNVINKKSSVKITKDNFEMQDKECYITECKDLSKKENKNWTLKPKNELKFSSETEKLLTESSMLEVNDKLEKIYLVQSASNNINNKPQKLVNISTQTDEIILEKSSCFTQTYRFEDVFTEDDLLTFESKGNVSEIMPKVSREESKEKFDGNERFSEKNKEVTALDDKDRFLTRKCELALSNQSCVNSDIGIDSFVDKDDVTFEKEFQESFLARRNLLEKEDFTFINDDYLNSKSEDKNQCESVVKPKNQNTEFSESSDSDNDEPISQRKELDISDYRGARCSFDTSYNNFRKKIECSLSAKLRSLGVDPDWSGICNKISDKTNSILTVRRINISKKIPQYLSMRNMLNNTVDQILEYKENG